MSSGNGTQDETIILRGDLVSKLAVAVSVLVQHVEVYGQGDAEPGKQVLDAIRESCLAIVENIWLRDLHDAYEASRRRREAMYKQSATVRDLREKMDKEDASLRREIEAISRRLEETLDATQGRYAKASAKLTSALGRILD